MIEQLKEIRKSLRHGEFKVLATLSKVNNSTLSIYLKYAGKAVLKPYIVKNIIDGWNVFKKENR